MHGTLDLQDPTRAGDIRPSRRRWWPLALLLALVAAGVGVYFWQSGGAGTGEPGAAGAGRAADQPPPRVTVLVPGRVSVAAEVSGTGSIAARRTSPVGVQGEGGMVTAVLVQENDFVRRGQVLARIDRVVQEQQTRQMEAGVRQAQADAALAQAELDRARALVERGFISKADIDRRVATRDSAAARTEVARAQLGEMRARVARLDVRAPEDGLILTRSVEAGQVVGPGSGALFTMAQGGAMEMRALVAEQDLASVRPGQPARVTIVGSDRVFEGTVWLVDPTIDPRDRQGSVRVALGNDRALRPGAFARATILAGEAAYPVLPQSAVLSDDNGNYVMIVDAQGRVARRGVTVGSVSTAGLAIRDGLSGQERVVASAAAFLSPGERVAAVTAGRAAR